MIIIARGWENVILLGSFCENTIFTRSNLGMKLDEIIRVSGDALSDDESVMRSL